MAAGFVCTIASTRPSHSPVGTPRPVLQVWRTPYSESPPADRRGWCYPRHSAGLRRAPSSRSTPRAVQGQTPPRLEARSRRDPCRSVSDHEDVGLLANLPGIEALAISPRGRERRRSAPTHRHRANLRGNECDRRLGLGSRPEHFTCQQRRAHEQRCTQPRERRHRKSSPLPTPVPSRSTHRGADRNERRNDTSAIPRRSQGVGRENRPAFLGRGTGIGSGGPTARRSGAAQT